MCQPSRRLALPVMRATLRSGINGVPPVDRPLSYFTPASRIFNAASQGDDRRMNNERTIERAYEMARERYAELGVDVERALATLRSISISLHCWQGDDVGGFESSAGLTGGGIQATGNY